MHHPLQARIETVSNATADADELITLAVPPDESLGEARKRIQEDHASAEYGDGEASTNVTDALEAARRLLNEYDEIPENGLALYVGVVDGELVEHVFDDLPSPVAESTFEYANEFDLEPLEAATTSSEAFGLLVVERGGAVVGRLVDDRIETVASLDSDVPGKTRAGGQSDRRFERDRDRQKEAFYETVAAHAKRAFHEDTHTLDVDVGGDGRSDAEEATGADAPDAADAPDSDAAATGDQGERVGGGELSIAGLLLGGTTVTVEEFRDGKYLDHRLQDAIVDDYPVEYATEQGLRELVQRAGDDLESVRRADARDVLETFYESMEDDDVVYGRDRTDDALTYDAVETLLISDDLSPETASALEERVEAQGGDSVVVSTDAERGRRFHDAFDGVAALLRFPIE